MYEALVELSHSFIVHKNQPYQRYFIRTQELGHRLCILLGQRGVGKTTTLVQYLLQKSQGDVYSSKILYLQADHFLVGDNSLYEISEYFYNSGCELIAIDEIHKYTDWSMELKSIMDTFPKLEIIASGSSALEIHKGSHDLSRRCLVYKMAGVSFREYIELEYDYDFSAVSLTDLLQEHEGISRDVVKVIEEKEQKILPLFRDYIQKGFYPYVHELKSVDAYYLTLEQNLHTTLESDLLAIYPSLAGASIKKIKQLLAFIAAQVPFMPHWKKLQTLLGVGDIRTLKTYFKYLEDAEIIRTLLPSSNKLKKLEGDEKIYLNNTNLLHAIAKGKQNIGTIRETFMLSMLSQNHEVAAPKKGDFFVDNNIVLEVGGRKKNFEQIKDEKNAFVVSDDIEFGARKKIPLWLFGFLY